MPLSYFNRARVYLAMGNKALACLDLRRACDLGYVQVCAVEQENCGRSARRGLSSGARALPALRR